MQIEELTPDMLGSRETARDYATNSDQVFKIALGDIAIRDGFNVRHDMGDIKALAVSIIENGQSVPGRVDVLKEPDEDGKVFILVDGHRRFAALQLLAEQGNDCYFMAVVNKSKTTEEQRILQMFTTQDNKPLEPVEVAELFQRLVNLGYKQKEIAKKVGRSQSYVSQMLDLAGEGPAVKQMVREKKVTPADLTKMRKETKSPAERHDKITSAVQSGQQVSKVLKSGAQEKVAKRIAKAILADELIQTEARLIEIILQLL